LSRTVLPAPRTFCWFRKTWAEGEDGFPGAPTKWPYRIDQCLAYCTPLDTLSAVLVCFFVNGDYDGNRVPQVHGWEFEFSEQERSETWQALLGLAEDQR
jgi:hypothetical protein